MLTIDMDKKINKYIDQLINEKYDLNNDSFITELKMRIWDRANALAQERDEDFNEEFIKEIIDNIGIVEEFLKEPATPNYKWQLNKIVDEDLCAKCGTCSIVCPNNLIDFTNQPELKEQCLREGNGMCQEVCPRTNSGAYQISIRENFFEENYYGNGNIKGQSGGVVTTFLQKLIEDNKIDGAIVVGDDHWKPLSLIVTGYEGLADARKSKYTISSLSAIREAGEMGLKRVAVVALPCQVAGLRKIQHYQYLAKHSPERGKNGKPAELPEIKYVLGLFCTGKFDYKDLSRVLENKNIDIKDVIKFNVDGPNFIVSTKDKDTKIKLSDMSLSPGCLMCRDFDAQLADISFGEKGSPEGNTTIIVRTETGRDIANYIDLQEEVKVKNIQKMREFKEKRFKKEVARREKENQYNSYYYNGDYGGIGQAQNGFNFVRFRSNPAGFYDADVVIKVAEITKKYGGKVKLTNRGEFEIHEIEPKYSEPLLLELRKIGLINGGEGPLVRSTLACPGNQHCMLGLIDTIDLAEKCEDKYAEKPFTYKFKIAVSGCPNKCVRPQVTDFGINGVKYPITIEEKCTGCGRCQDVCKVDALEIRGDIAITNPDICIGCGKCFNACPNDAKDVLYEGYSLYIGGKGGREMVQGSQMFVESEEELFETLEAVQEIYSKNGKKPQKERLAGTMKRMGVATFLRQVEEFKNQS
ncbi:MULTISPECIES: Coenzyme F420 hydrogenase/dehydrogenase, beta subunit C-terminal domain [unclassified Methanobrevibacter]|jgi:coenzyme F420 hydrogenase subunit beta|uniref:Coenzyme F420 hydrogenase/dehydrogenase, beta subunit C-terminal domain n=1 Tax=unclassified Methanobrevibacter TaxID=2638681 RepID=UPI003763818B|nr:Coenzyme F420 hydrogenase/dehydrogenase, beta subunit C-terminal domain [Methanobacteriaceae archaeon]